MPAAKRTPAAAQKAAAARGEKKQAGPKRLEWRGLTLDLPDKLGGELYFDLAALERDQASPAAQVALLASLIGDEQVYAVRAKIVEDQVSFEDIEEVLIELFSAIIEAYGTTAGESTASPDS